MAEVYHHLAKAPVWSSSDKRLAEIQVSCASVLAFNDLAQLEPLGIDEISFKRGDYQRSREIGAAARFLDIEGLIVPSARYRGQNIVLFPDRLSTLESIRVSETLSINWPAWREKTKDYRPM